MLSLQRSSDRRAHVAAELAAHNITFDFVEALDGDDILPEEEVVQYVAGPRLAKYRVGASNARYKVACDLSHFRLMHALLGGVAPAQLVLEDDFDIPGSTENLLQVCWRFVISVRLE